MNTPASSASGRDPDSPYGGVEYSTASGWAAWVLFAAFVMAVVGVLEAVMGLVALLNPDGVAGSRSARLLPAGDAALGWVHLTLGVLVVSTGIGLLLGRVWARVAAVVLAVAAVLVNLVLIDAFPVWGSLAIGFALLTVYAVTVHGGELAEAQGHSLRSGPAGSDRRAGQT